MDNTEFQRAVPSGIDMLIVGGGIAGLTLAIEGFRKGHDVRVIEKRDCFDGLGDVFGLSASAFQTLLKWPGFVQRLKSKALDPILHFWKYDGTWIIDTPKPPNGPGEPGFTLSRAHAHDCLFEYAQQLGISVTFSQQVVEYLEDGDSASVKLSDGSILSADVIIAADGVGSKSHTLLSSSLKKPISSGYAMFRATYPLADAMRDPDVAAHWKGKNEYLSIIIGPDTHIVIGKNDARDTICWLLTHKDIDNTSRETWSITTKASNALKFVPEEAGWAKWLRALIMTTTNDECIDWRLMWRDPQPLWHSPKGRVVQVGDSCHPFLPTSGSGAVMAMEDAYSLAACLQLAGKGKIPLAVQVHNKLRFERVSCAQKMGFKTRHQWHNPNWKFIEENPQEALRIIGKWVYFHDSEEYAYQNFNSCVDHILHDSAFKNTNIPPGYEYQPWTADELLKVSADGGEITDSGDWS